MGLTRLIALRIISQFVSELYVFKILRTQYSEFGLVYEDINEFVISELEKLDLKTILLPLPFIRGTRTILNPRFFNIKVDLWASYFDMGFGYHYPRG